MALVTLKGPQDEELHVNLDHVCVITPPFVEAGQELIALHLVGVVVRVPNTSYNCQVLDITQQRAIHGPHVVLGVPSRH